jgi:hypothetical protein
MLSVTTPAIPVGSRWRSRKHPEDERIVVRSNGVNVVVRNARNVGSRTKDRLNTIRVEQFVLTHVRVR